VIDRGRLVQLAPPAELLAAPSSATVAALTGANVIDGTAYPVGEGAVVRLAGGGELHAATHADGPVQIAIHPWELQLGDPASSSVTDTVVSGGPIPGAVVTRLTRFTVQSGPNAALRPPFAKGQLVGLNVAPANVRVFTAPSADEKPV
jgi:ABC-type sulfate/molybdate transport systems ATPase subunit